MTETNKNIRFLSKNNLQKIKNNKFNMIEYKRKDVPNFVFLQDLALIIRIINIQLEIMAKNGLKKSLFGVGTKKANITNRLLKMQEIILSKENKTEKFLYDNILFILISAIAYRNDYQISNEQVIKIKNMINETVNFNDTFIEQKTILNFKNKYYVNKEPKLSGGGKTISKEPNIENYYKIKITSKELLSFLMNIIDVIIGRGSSYFGVPGTVKTKFNREYNNDVPDYNQEPVAYIIYMFAFIYDRWMTKENIQKVELFLDDGIKKFRKYRSLGIEYSNEELFNNIKNKLNGKNKVNDKVYINEF